MQCIPKLESEGFEESSEQVGPYIIENVLGEGQFATVKLCRKKQRPRSATLSHGGKFVKYIFYNLIVYFSLKRESNDFAVVFYMSNRVK